MADIQKVSKVVSTTRFKLPANSKYILTLNYTLGNNVLVSCLRTATSEAQQSRHLNLMQNLSKNDQMNFFFNRFTCPDKGASPHEHPRYPDPEGESILSFQRIFCFKIIKSPICKLTNITK